MDFFITVRNVRIIRLVASAVVMLVAIINCLYAFDVIELGRTVVLINGILMLVCLAVLMWSNFKMLSVLKQERENKNNKKI